MRAKLATHPQVRPLPKTPSECGCGQTAKTIVLVGCTQQGKSSLVRSILDYGGYREEADSVTIGAFGNVSQTKECKEFAVAIPLMKHYLAPERAGSLPRIIDLQKDEPDDLDDLVPRTLQTRRHVHLKIIDTPGLNDTNNNNNADGICTNDDGTARRDEDERHKVAIFDAISDLDAVHAVCFVLDVGHNLGKTFQTMIREYMDIFRMSQLARSFHFFHTKVDRDRLFGKTAQSRPNLIDDLFGIGEKKEHHFINNIPIEDDPISQHFSRWGLSMAFAAFDKENPQPVQFLRMPKSEDHLQMDEALKRTLRLELADVECSVKSKEAEKDQLETQRRAAESRLKSEERSVRELEAKVAGLDTCDLELVGNHCKKERSHTFSSRISFFVCSDSPSGITIRDWTEESSANSYWTSGPSLTSSEMYCYADLKSIDWGCAIWGRIKLYGWRKEAKATELASAKKSRDEAEEDCSLTREKINSATEEILQLSSQLTAFKSKIPILKRQMEHLNQDYIPWETFKAHKHCFASSSISAYRVAALAGVDSDALLLSQTAQRRLAEKSVSEFKWSQVVKSILSDY